MRATLNILKWLALVPLAGLFGCAGNALSEDFADYSRIYGDSMNKQLLLNLARESHNEPVYFIQLASISSQYQFTTSTGFNASHTRTAPPNQGAADEVQNALTLGGTINAGVQQTPVFSFLPLNGATYAQTLATPIPAKVFNELYDQGFPADMLLRVMVDEIRIKGGASGTHPQYLRNNPYDATYPAFLRFCDNMFYAQRAHAVIAATPDTGDAKTADPVAKRLKGPTTVFSAPRAKLRDIVAAYDAKLDVKYDTNGYTITKPSDDLQLVLNDNPSDEELENHCPKAFANQYFGDAAKAEFRFRSFEAVMYCVAKEEGYFEDLAKPENQGGGGITFENNRELIACVPANGSELSPGCRVRPILTIKYGDEQRADLRKTAEIWYEGECYTIGDPAGEGSGETFKKNHFADNRTAFTLIAYLFSEVAVDTKNLPPQQLIQVQ